MSTNLVEMPNEWENYLLMTEGKSPRPKGNLANCLVALTKAPEWKGLLVWNEFTRKIQLTRKTPWGTGSQDEWGDNDDRKTTEWLQHHDIDVPVHVTTDAVLTAAAENTINPLFDYLNDLIWDKWDRVENWMTWYLGVEETEYTRAVGRAWLLSAVARAYQPGCKADCCLILEGPQGKGKSTALSILAGGPTFFSDYTTDDLGSKEAAILCRGVWIVEFAELEGLMQRANKVETVKAFLSRTHDRYRPVNGRHPIQVPRQCVFAATTNKDSYMHDETGNRRFWPVKCGKIDTASLARDRDQLWAEAVHRYRDLEEDWWLSKAVEQIAITETKNRLESDAWQEAINEFLAPRSDVRVEDILINCLSKNIDSWTKQDQMQVARCLKIAGWEKFRVPGKGNIRWRRG